MSNFIFVYRLYGSYEALQAGFTTRALQDLTGGIVQSFSLSVQDRFLTYQVLNSAVPRSTLLVSSINVVSNLFRVFFYLEARNYLFLPRWIKWRTSPPMLFGGWFEFNLTKITLKMYSFVILKSQKQNIFIYPGGLKKCKFEEIINSSIFIKLNRLYVLFALYVYNFLMLFYILVLFLSL